MLFFFSCNFFKFPFPKFGLLCSQKGSKLILEFSSHFTCSERYREGNQSALLSIYIACPVISILAVLFLMFGNMFVLF